MVGGMDRFFNFCVLVGYLGYLYLRMLLLLDCTLGMELGVLSHLLCGLCGLLGGLRDLLVDCLLVFLLLVLLRARLLLMGVGLLLMEFRLLLMGVGLLLMGVAAKFILLDLMGLLMWMLMLM